MWSAFRKLTSYQDFIEGDMLPLLDDNDNPVFSKDETCDILKETFFSGKHLSAEKFDANFKDKIEESY